MQVAAPGGNTQPASNIMYAVIAKSWMTDYPRMEGEVPVYHPEHQPHWTLGRRPACGRMFFLSRVELTTDVAIW